MKLPVLLAGALLLGPFLWSDGLQACDSTELNFVSIAAGPGGTYDLTVEYCIGGGILGLNQGAGGNTGTMAFGFYSSVPITVNSFTPTMTSDTTGCTLNGMNAGPNFGANVVIGYIAGACQFACITSTAACGEPHSDCGMLTFNVDVIPDSIRLFGAEGGGAPLAGCYPNADMAIDFAGAVLNAEVISLQGQARGNKVELQWQARDQAEVKAYLIERRSRDGDWEMIGRVAAAEPASSGYEWSQEVMPNTWLYRVQAREADGTIRLSPLVEIVVEESLPVRIFPNPAANQVTFQRGWSVGDRLLVRNLHGQLVARREVRAAGDGFTMNVAAWPRGIYTAVITTATASREVQFLVTE